MISKVPRRFRATVGDLFSKIILFPDNFISIAPFEVTMTASKLHVAGEGSPPDASCCVLVREDLPLNVIGV